MVIEACLGGKMREYRILARQDQDYWGGGPIFDPLYLCSVYADSRQEAIMKGLKITRRRRLGWKVDDLLARPKRRS